MGGPGSGASTQHRIPSTQQNPEVKIVNVSIERTSSYEPSLPPGRPLTSPGPGFVVFFLCSRYDHWAFEYHTLILFSYFFVKEPL